MKKNVPELINWKELCKTSLKSSFCLSIFPTITSKYVYQLSGKTLLLSVFGFLGLRYPHFQEFRCFLVFVRTVGSSLN